MQSFSNCSAGKPCLQELPRRRQDVRAGPILHEKPVWVKLVGDGKVRQVGVELLLQEIQIPHPSHRYIASVLLVEVRTNEPSRGDGTPDSDLRRVKGFLDHISRFCRPPVDAVLRVEAPIHVNVGFICPPDLILEVRIVLQLLEVPTGKGHPPGEVGKLELMAALHMVCLQADVYL